MSTRLGTLLRTSKWCTCFWMQLLVRVHRYNMMCIYIIYIYACLIYAFCNAASHVYDYIIYMVLLKLCYIIFITICRCVYMVLYLYVATCTYCFAYTCIHMYCIVIHLPNRGTAYSVSFAIIHTRSVYIRYIYIYTLYIYAIHWLCLYMLI